MSQKSGLEGTFRWIPVSQELPDDSETVLICNLRDWDDPVASGFYTEGKWERCGYEGCPLDGKGYSEEGIEYPDPAWNPPTHWMHFPEPPEVAQLPELEAFPQQQAAIFQIVSERFRQQQKWGPQTHEMPVWMCILHEETGELSEAILHAKFGGNQSKEVFKEAVQVAAVAMQIVEFLLDGKTESEAAK